jgi:hypothetical protein
MPDTARRAKDQKPWEPGQQEQLAISGVDGLCSYYTCIQTLEAKSQGRAWLTMFLQMPTV